MKGLVILAIVACSLVVSGCVFVRLKDNGTDKVKAAGNGIIVDKDYPVEPFSSMQLNVPADVFFETSETCGLSFNMDESLIENLTVSVENGTLKIGSDVNSWRFKKFVIHVSAPSLEKLVCRGAVDFTANGTVRGDAFELEVNGAADVDLARLDVRTASFVINGAGDIDVNLEDADAVCLNINGAGDATLSGKVREAKVTISGVGDADLTGLDYESLDRRTNGIGSVKTGKKRL